VPLEAAGPAVSFCSCRPGSAFDAAGQAVTVLKLHARQCFVLHAVLLSDYGMVLTLYRSLVWLTPVAVFVFKTVESV
jgi:hypothetical protein